MNMLTPARAHAGRRTAFWGAAYAYGVTMLGTTLPTPLYGLYEARFGFGAATLTIVFATYVGGVLLALLLFGPLSDRIGRRPVAFAALAVAALGAGVFLAVQSVPLLLVGRFVSGLAAGLITGAAAAILTELEPRRDTHRASLVTTAVSTIGLGLGPVLAGALAEWAPLPIRVPFAAYLGLVAVALLAVWLMPETVHVRPAGPRWRPRRPAVPAPVRATFVTGSAAVFAGFAILGFFTSLAPTFLRDELGIGNLALTGLIAFAAFAASGAAQVLLHRLSDRVAMTAGAAAVAPALLLIVLALRERSLPLFVAGAIAGGVGSGLTFRGSLGLINGAAPAARRAETVSAYFVVTYLALALPVVGLGFAVQRYGLYPAAVGFGAAIGGLALAVTGVALRTAMQHAAAEQVPLEAAERHAA